jgi:hypothetical protein
VLPAITHSEHVGVEAAVMGSEIEQLPDLAGYLKLASSPAWLRVGLQPAVAARGPAVSQPGTRGTHSPGPTAGLGRESECGHEGFEPDSW